ncbi:MAG: hypothetical protein AAB288_07925 [Acidobacteriota bacterium]
MTLPQAPALPVTSSWDIFVVGDLGTDGQYSRYGRKIEAAIENKRAGAHTQIIREEDFQRALQR